MHMADALLSPAVGGVMTAVSAGAIGLSVAKIKNDNKNENPERFDEKKVPVMAVMGAFIFAAQMINFTIPGTGSSGHIGGGILLAAILGPFPALLTLASVLLIQCLFFADGGLLAYGCNVFNIGVCACLFSYQIIYKPIIKKWGFTKKTISFAAVLSAIIGLQAGAFAVVLETLISGVTNLPFLTFTVLMQPIHLAIGIIEGIVTAAVLCFIHSVRPEILDRTVNINDNKKKSYKKVLLIFIIITLLTAGIFPIFASQLPDGLEWAIEKTAGDEELENPDNTVHEAAENIVNSTAIMPDYSLPGDNQSKLNTAFAGVAGSIITVVLAGSIGFVIYIVKSKRKPAGES